MKLIRGLTASSFSIQGLSIGVVHILKIMFLGNCSLQHFENEIAPEGFNLEERKGLHSLILYHMVICREKTLKHHLSVSH